MIETTQTNLAIGDRFRLEARGYRNKSHIYTVEAIQMGHNIARPDLVVFECAERTPSGMRVGVEPDGDRPGGTLTLPDVTLADFQERGWVKPV